MIRDGGKCAKCNLDCKGVIKGLKAVIKATEEASEGGGAGKGAIGDTITGRAMQEYLASHAPGLQEHVKLSRPRRGRTRLKEGSVWEADHVVAVVDGGGCCGLRNYRTLCRSCHLEETRALMQNQKKKNKRIRAIMPKTQSQVHSESDGGSDYES